MKRTSILFLAFTIALLAHAQSPFAFLNAPQNTPPSRSVVDSLMPPTGLQAEIDDDDVLLTWFPPGNGPGQFLTYADTIPANFIGLTDMGTYQFAAKWDPEQIEDLDGEFITRIDFLPGSEVSSYTLKIWEGPYAQTLVYEQDIPEVDSLLLNEIQLDLPVVVDASDELWIGIEVSQPAIAFPIAVDAGPAIAGYSDLIYIEEEWRSMVDFGLNNNWILRAFVTQSGSDNGPLKMLTGRSGSSQNSLPDGYNVFRDGTQLNQSLVTDLEWEDADLSNGLYNYEVTAVYDSSESDPAQINVLIGGPELTLLPDSLAIFTQSDSTETVILQLLNTGGDTLEWTAESEADWLTAGASSGEIYPGDTTFLPLTVDATGLFSGDYDTEIVFTTNNLNDPETEADIYLFVTGNAELTITPDSLDFGDVVVGQTKTLQVYLENTGSDDLFITDIESATVDFLISDQEFYMTPGEGVFLNVTFLPTEQDDYIGELTVFSNDPLNPETSVYLNGTGTLAQPLNFQGSVSGNVVNLSWLDPSGGPGTYLFYGDGANASAIGLVTGGVWQMAHKWEAAQLAAFEGESIVKMRFYYFTGVSEYTLKIWTADSLPELLYQQYIGLIEDSASWQEVLLDEPFLIDGETDLLVGFEVNQEINAFPAGIDFGPAVVGYGDKVSLDGTFWGNLSDLGLNSNWSLQTFVSGTQEPLPAPEARPGPQNSDLRPFEIVSAPETWKSADRGLDDFLGFNLYRNDSLLNTTYLSEFNYSDTLQEPGEYSYTLTAVYDEGESSPVGPLTFTIDTITLLAPATWSMTESDVHHQIMLPAAMVEHEENDLMPGDFVGVFFDHDGEHILAGMSHWDGNNTEFIAFGDHFLTPAKDGFTEGDQLHWRIYRPSADKEYEAIPVYDESMPDWDGEFSANGSSGLNALMLQALNTEERQSGDLLQVFPNPVSEVINLAGIEPESEIFIYGTDGKLWHTETAGNTRISIQAATLPSGIYQVIVLNKGQSLSKTIVVR